MAGMATAAAAGTGTADGAAIVAGTAIAAGVAGTVATVATVASDSGKFDSAGAKLTSQPVDNNTTIAQTSTSDTVDPQGTVEKSEGEIYNAPSESSDSTDSDDSDAEEEIITLKCLICHEGVSAPCWYCIDCKREL